MPTTTHDWRRRIADVPGWLKDDEAALLFKSARDLSHLGRVVEVGSFLGRSTICLAAGLDAADRPAHETVLAIDPHAHPPTVHPDYQGRHDTPPREAFEANLRAAAARERVEILEAFSINAYPRVPDRCALVFIDGDHRYDAVAADLLHLGAKLHPGGRLLLHDYRSWEGVTRAVDEAAASDRWTLDRTVDSIAVLRPSPH